MERGGVGLGEPLVPRPAASREPLLHWTTIFFTNVFFACISFSIVMPSLYLYLSSMGASPSFYALVVAIYSVGEAFGSMALGSLSNLVGTRRAMQICALISMTGAISYAMADAWHRLYGRSSGAPPVGPYMVLVGRLMQGVGSGGQQACEQAYISIAAPLEERTQLTGKLSTFACLGFIFGPMVGALVTLVPDFALGEAVFSTFTKQGWVCALMNLSMFVTGTCCFVEVRLPAAAADDEEKGTADDGRSGSLVLGIWACIAFFFVHFNGFAVQETITTPIVKEWFGWDEVAANLLFTASGVGNLLCAVAMSVLSGPRRLPDGSFTQLVSDRTLLLWSLSLAAGGWLLLVPLGAWFSPAGAPRPTESMGQFLVGFAMVTLAFPFGRGVCLAMVGKLLGDQPQGAWMGIMFALGAIARIAGPFWAVTGYYSFGAAAVFGSTALLFLLSLLASRGLWDVLIVDGDDGGDDDGRPSLGGSRLGVSPAASPGLARFMASPMMHPVQHPGPAPGTPLSSLRSSVRTTPVRTPVETTPVRVQAAPSIEPIGFFLPSSLDEAASDDLPPR